MAASAEGKCPDCGTAELTCGREVCQACAVVRILAQAAAARAGG